MSPSESIPTWTTWSEAPWGGEGVYGERVGDWPGALELPLHVRLAPSRIATAQATPSDHVRWDVEPGDRLVVVDSLAVHSAGWLPLPNHSQATSAASVGEAAKQACLLRVDQDASFGGGCAVISW